MIIEIRTSQDGQYYAVVKGKNGEDWYVSETYPDFATAHGSAERLYEAMMEGRPMIVDHTS
jgi:uncharacterized protein YegP (UPF0339 family)